MADLNESEINHLKAIVGFSDTSASTQQNIEVKAQDNIIPKEQTKIIQNNDSIESVKTVQSEPIESGEKDTDLFVKIDEHVVIAQDLMNSKKEVKGVSDTVLLLAKAEKLKADAIERMESHLDKLDVIIQDVEIKLTAPESLKMPDSVSMSEDSGELVDLQGELNNLKNELSKMN